MMQFSTSVAYSEGASDFATQVNAEKARVWAALNDIEEFGEMFGTYLFGDGVVPYLNDLRVTALTGPPVAFQVDTGAAMVKGFPVTLSVAATQGIAGNGANYIYLNQAGAVVVYLSGGERTNAILLATGTVVAGAITAVVQDEVSWWLAADAFLSCVGPFRNGVSRNGSSAFNGGCWE
jgi:hypothetical protein